jgi:hypothetical protein
VTTKGFGYGGKYSADPIGSAGASTSQRKASRDPGLTPSERYTKSKLMNQFRRTGEGPGGNSVAYVTSASWCSEPLCRRLATGGGKCDGHKP